MMALLLTAALACPATKLINIDLRVVMDRWTYDRAKARCKQIYPKSPCLVVLKKDERTIDYYATCGAKR